MRGNKEVDEDKDYRDDYTRSLYCGSDPLDESHSRKNRLCIHRLRICYISDLPISFVGNELDMKRYPKAIQRFIDNAPAEYKQEAKKIASDLQKKRKDHLRIFLQTAAIYAALEIVVDFIVKRMT